MQLEKFDAKKSFGVSFGFSKINFGKADNSPFLIISCFFRNSMNKKCPNCQLTNFAHSKECVRCQFKLIEVSTMSEKSAKTSFLKSKLFRRAVICVVVCIFALLGFYLSMIFTSAPLKSAERKNVAVAIKILDEKGFSTEVFLLTYLTSFRSNDNWLNASTRLENAYAATIFRLR